MKSRSLKRRKALFGVDGAITAAATIGAAVMQANATRDAARQQAEAIRQQAQTQSQIMDKTNANNNALQQKNIDFTRQQNEQNRQLQNNIQMTLQMMTGQQNSANRREANKIQLKRGGKLANQSSLRGVSNLPFVVTDGGGVIPIGTTPEGFNLYELYGNDHEHYHKTRSGKAKTGVGIKFANGETIEGEGNQNSNNGELLLTTPNDALFISKHSIKGFNPANAVRAGMNPIVAFNTQEAIKDRYGLSDDGKSNRRLPVKKMTSGGIMPFDISYEYNPLDFATSNTATAALINRPSLKCGGRKRAANGGDTLGWNLLGAGLTGLGNFGGALINMGANRRASSILSGAYTDAANAMIDAYSRMGGIDMSNIRREDYAASHAMANVLTPRVNVNPRLELVNRNASAQTRAVNNNTLSSAARLNRLAGISDRAQQMRNEIYADAANRENQMGQANMQQINQVAMENARLDTQANQAYGNAYLNLLQYNNDIENEKLAGIGQARANSIMGIGETRANTRLANAQALGAAITGTAEGFGNALTSYAKYKEDYANTLAGANMSNLYSIRDSGSPWQRRLAQEEIERRQRRFNSDYNQVINHFVNSYYY